MSLLLTVERCSLNQNLNDENLINERVLKRKGGEGGVVERFSMINNVCFFFFFWGGGGGVGGGGEASVRDLRKFSYWIASSFLWVIYAMLCP